MFFRGGISNIALTLTGSTLIPLLDVVDHQSLHLSNSLMENSMSGGPVCASLNTFGIFIEIQLFFELGEKVEGNVNIKHENGDAPKLLQHFKINYSPMNDIIDIECHNPSLLGREKATKARYKHITIFQISSQEVLIKV